MNPLSRRVLAASVAVLLSSALASCTTGPSESGANYTGSDSTFVLKDSEKGEKQGAVWFPTTYTVKLNTGDDERLGAPLSSLRLRDLGIVIVKSGDPSFKKVVGLKTFNGGASSVALSFDDSSRVFYAPPTVLLPAGSYRLSHIKAVMVDESSERPQELELPLPNPLARTDQKAESSRDALQFEIAAGRVSALGRFAFSSGFGVKEERLTSQMRAEMLESERISAQVVLKQLNWGISKQPLLKPASPDSPDIRYSIPVTKVKDRFEKTNASAKELVAVGFQVSFPCEVSGFLKFVWKEQSVAAEYTSITGLNAADGKLWF